MVTATAALLGVMSCGQEVALSVGRDCRDLVVSLAIRVGAVAGLATVGMFLIVAGLIQMAARMEEQRRARERLSEDRGIG